MPAILKLKDLAKRIRKLPVIGELTQLADQAAVDAVLSSPTKERVAALAGVVPKRCGLCRSFNLERAQEQFAADANWMTAAGFLGPMKMGRKSTEELPERASEAARALRPNLSEKFEDYGLCLKYGRILWGFEEAPAMPESSDPPCADWE